MEHPRCAFIPTTEQLQELAGQNTSYCHLAGKPGETRCQNICEKPIRRLDQAASLAIDRAFDRNRR